MGIAICCVIFFSSSSFFLTVSFASFVRRQFFFFWQQNISNISFFFHWVVCVCWFFYVISYQLLLWVARCCKPTTISTCSILSLHLDSLIYFDFDRCHSAIEGIAKNKIRFHKKIIFFIRNMCIVFERRNCSWKYATATPNGLINISCKINEKLKRLTSKKRKKKQKCAMQRLMIND